MHLLTNSNLTESIKDQLSPHPGKSQQFLNPQHLDKVQGWGKKEEVPLSGPKCVKILLGYFSCFLLFRNHGENMEILNISAKSIDFRFSCYEKSKFLEIPNVNFSTKVIILLSAQWCPCPLSVHDTFPIMLKQQTVWTFYAWWNSICIYIKFINCLL